MAQLPVSKKGIEVVIHTLRSTLIGLGIAGASALALIPSTAQASPISTNICSSAPLSQPFAAFGDYSSYELMPGGDFSDGSWTLSNGASILGDQNSLDGDSNALDLPVGSSALSPTTCVDAAYPDLRMFIKSLTPGSMVSVSAIYGNTTLPLGVVTGASSWGPSPVLLNGSALMGLESDGVSQMALQLTALSGTTDINGVYVDPRSGY